MQGISTAEWQTPQLTRAYTSKLSAQDPNTPGFPGILPAAGEPDTRNLAGRLKVMTSGLRPGYLRNNGVPYSANAVLTGSPGKGRGLPRRHADCGRSAVPECA